MAIRTVEEFKQSIQDDRVVYFHGERVKDINEHPVFKRTLSQMALDYLIPQDPDYRDLFVDRMDSGEEVRFLHQPETRAEDLMRRRKIIQLLARIGFGIPGGSNTTGKDALNALSVVCSRMDRLTGSNYMERVELYRQRLFKTDPAVIGAITDVKGDRSLRPSKQVPHKDYYVRVVDRTQDGIVVRGAKAHISLAPCANEMIVMPCRRHLEDDKDYAVAFVIPVNAKGITMICTDDETLDFENSFDHPYSSGIFFADAVVVFDDVFVPTERVFMDGEWRFSGDMAYAFGNSHRLFADSYKYVELEILVGAAALIAEYNGLEKIPHVRDKLSWLTMYCEAVEALAETACVKCISEPDSNLVYPNPMYSNITKYYFADNYHQAIKNVQDIAGGLVATIPSSKDFFNPETRPMLEKYLGGKAGIPTEHRLRALRLIRDLSSGWHAILTIHGEGSLATQRMSVLALADLERYKAAARRVARIKSDDEHPLFRDLPEYPLKNI